MNKLLFILGAVTLMAQYLFSQDLPRYFTEAERKLAEKYTPLELFENTNPPTFDPRTAAEWEEMQGLLITWDSDFNSMLGQITLYAQAEGKVYIVTTNQSYVENYFQSISVPLANIVFIDEPTNAFWTRDYGPITIYEDYTENLSLVDWKYYSIRPLDDAIPSAVADF